MTPKAQRARASNCSSEYSSYNSCCHGIVPSKPNLKGDATSEFLQQIREALMTEGLMKPPRFKSYGFVRSWFADAEELKFHNANAMTVATVDSDIAPSVRNVLLRGRLEEGLVFYTNYESDKAVDLDQTTKRQC